MTDSSPVPGELPPPAVPTPAPRRRGLIILITVLVVVVVGGGAAFGTTVLLNVAGEAAKTTSNPSADTFTSKKFGYSVALPGKPTVSEMTSDSGNPVERVQLNSGLQVLTLEAERIPVKVPQDRIASVVDAALTGGAKALKGTDVRQVKSFSLDGAPARSELMDTIQLGTAYNLVAVHGNVIFILIISHETTKLDQSVADSFTFAK